MTRREALLAAAGVLVPVKAVEAVGRDYPFQLTEDRQPIDWFDQRPGDVITAILKRPGYAPWTWTVAAAPTQDTVEVETYTVGPRLQLRGGWNTRSGHDGAEPPFFLDDRLEPNTPHPRTVRTRIHISLVRPDHGPIPGTPVSLYVEGGRRRWEHMRQDNVVTVRRTDGMTDGPWGAGAVWVVQDALPTFNHETHIRGLNVSSLRVIERRSGDHYRLFLHDYEPTGVVSLHAVRTKSGA